MKHLVADHALPRQVILGRERATVGAGEVVR
jgi:hypothetical protein